MPFDTVILNDGNKYPTLAFGTGSKWKFHDVTQYVEQALNAGFSHIDTAAYYETEPYVGDALKESGLARSEFYVTTKYANGAVDSSIKTSLSKLGLKYVDMYLIHNTNTLPDVPSVWRGFERAQKDGYAKSIGVSNCDLKRLKQLLQTANVKPAVNQILFHPYNYKENKELLEYAKSQGIMIEAYSSLTPITRYPGGPVDPVINAVAKRLNAKPTQVLLSWVRSKGVAIVTTSSKREHLDEYLAVADLPPLTEEEIAAIEEAGAKGPGSKSSSGILISLIIIATALILMARLIQHNF